MSDWPKIEELQKCLGNEDAAFEQWALSVPDKHWAKYDLSAVRVGFELGLRVAETERQT